jgi:hypothetical protein
MIRKLALVMICVLGALAFACDDGGKDSGDRVLSKLRTCDLLTDGKMNIPEDESGELDCIFDCYIAATCDELEAAICFDDTSASLEACIGGCTGGSTQDFECADGSDTIPGYWVCDCYEDCADGSDEADCPAGNCFQCGDGTSIEQDWVCDCYEDCADGSDEADCPSGACFACADGSYEIPSAAVCDCYPQCEDGSDEADCSNANCFACTDGAYSIPDEYVCDGESDCQDGSDEGAAQGCAEFICPQQ